MIKKVYIAIFLFLLIYIPGFFWIQNTEIPRSSVSATSTPTPTIDIIADWTTVESDDKILSFRYPPSWTLSKNSLPTRRGKFGPVFASWVLTNGAGPLQSQPTQHASLTIELFRNENGLLDNTLLDCTGKTVTCDTLQTKTTLLQHSVAILNTGKLSVEAAATADATIFHAAALIDGEVQSDLAKTVESILRSVSLPSSLPSP